jgi:hypothetical protein
MHSTFVEGAFERVVKPGEKLQVGIGEAFDKHPP